MKECHLLISPNSLGGAWRPNEHRWDIFSALEQFIGLVWIQNYCFTLYIPHFGPCDKSQRKFIHFSDMIEGQSILTANSRLRLFFLYSIYLNKKARSSL